MLAWTASTAQGTWSRIDVPTDDFLRAVYFTDSLYGWAVGNLGTIIHTSDGGETWVLQDSQTGNEITDIFFLNRDLGWASSLNYMVSPYGTVLLKTENGGEDWVSIPYPEENIFINCIIFRDSLNGWMGGSPHAILRTSDGGQSWQQAAVDTSILAFFPVLSIRFYDDNYGYACGGLFEIAGVIWRTTDGGESWQAIDPVYAPADEVHELHLYDSLHVIGAGGDPDFGYGVAFIRTDDGGVTWDYEEIGLQGNAFDLDFRTPMEAWAPLGQKRKLIYSLDGGDTWTEIDTPENTAIFSIMFPDSLHGFACGMDGAMLKYTPPYYVSVNDPMAAAENCVILHQNYPNPFRGKTIIEFRVLSSEFRVPNPKSTSPNRPIAQLSVYSLFGQHIITLLHQPLSHSEYQVEFDATGLPAGIYFYKLTVTGIDSQVLFSQTRKMIVTP